MTAIRFTLNGEPRAEEGVSPTTTALDWLRLHARQTGTKEGCAEGDCGACAIAVRRRGDEASPWRAVNSCLVLLPQLDGQDVLTVEGLSGEGEPLHPVQQALVETDATQCGFCTPGFAMTMFAFRAGGEPPEDRLIHEALAGNLCRCTGYRSIVEACRRIATSVDQPSPHPRPLPTRGRGEEALPQCFDYSHAGQVFHAPASLAELLALRAEFPDAILLGGGTDLGLRVSKEQEAFPRVISTAGVAELRTAGMREETLAVGGGATYTDALPLIDEHFPAFGTLIRRIGSRQIRNLGTVAGNLATASPIGDTAPCLIALDATVTLAAQAGVRTLPVERFITGYRKTALAPGEIIAAIRIPLLPAGESFAAYKLSKRFDQDISTVVAAFRLALRGGKVAALRAAFGGMAARVMRASLVEQAMHGRAWSPESLNDIDALLARDFSPIGDHRGSAAYRLRAAAGLLRRFQVETASVDVPTRVEAL